MKKRKLIIVISIALFLLLAGTSALAAFVFNATIDSNNYSGDITIEKEGYVSYSLNHNMSRSDFQSEEYYQAALKERAGGWLVNKEEETDLATNYANYFTRTVTEATTYNSSTQYFILDDTNNYVYRDIEAFEDGESYYTITYTKATSYSSSTDYYRVGHKYDSTVTSETNLSSYYVLSGLDLERHGIFTEASSYNSSTKYYKLVYVSDTLEANSIIDDPESEDNGVSCVNTYASERTGSLAEAENNIYLNQVGFEFSIKTKIACYMRIKFRDAWVSSKLYRGSSTPLVRYTSKKTISGRSPFYLNDENWYFDTVDNVLYLRSYIEASPNSYNYSFGIDQNYFYESDATAYTERMIVQVSYSLELIQANRAKTVWGKDPSEFAQN